MLWVSFGIIVLFGGATLLLHNAKFIMWKPTVLYWIFSAVIFTAPLFGRNVIKSLMSKQVELPDHAWSRLNASWGVFFAFLGIANLLVAYNYSEPTWVKFKLFGVLGLMFAFIIGQSMFITKYLDKESQDKKEKQ